jgi:hypothetical protein
MRRSDGTVDREQRQLEMRKALKKVAEGLKVEDGDCKGVCEGVHSV